MAAIYTLFSGLAATGWAVGAVQRPTAAEYAVSAGVATGIIGAMLPAPT